MADNKNNLKEIVGTHNAGNPESLEKIKIVDSTGKEISSNSNNSVMNSENSKDKVNLTDKDIALDLMADSKATIAVLAKALTETTNPQLRDTLRNQLTACVNSHYRLSDIAIGKGWYDAYTDPKQQLQQDLFTISMICEQ